MLRIDGFYIFDPWEGPEPGQYFVNVEKKKKKKKNRPVETKSHAAFCNVSLSVVVDRVCILDTFHAVSAPWSFLVDWLGLAMECERENREEYWNFL